ncbi:hypothetical protein BASA81_007844 [Batrachochytrium salamandrivorans]|nr:hypothetical protein BASA81_007844 [Batrachochytrium salamandrivorans]
MNTVAVLPIGVAFGMLVRSSGVYSPTTIRGQMIFHYNIMMKMFMGGMCGSALAFVVLQRLYPERFDNVRETKGFGDKGALAAVVGGMIQGVGMTLSGSCPGMIYAQLGAGSTTAPIVMLGGVAGAATYALLHPYLKPALDSDFARTLEGKFHSMHLDQVLFGGRYAESVLGLAAVALAVAGGFEYLFPSPEIPGYDLNPVLAGGLVGSLQLPLFLVVDSFLGMSSGYSVLSSQALRLLPDNCFCEHTYMRGFVKSKSVWQVVFGLGVALGAFLVPQVLPDVPSPTEVPPVQSLLGGFLLVFGARLVGGCASGHGLTGLPSLHVVSWLVVPSLFAGAIATGFGMAHFAGSANYLLLQT